ncbi:MAG: HGGxSTG domain-containing protein [Armatimonadota bacterium]
MWGKSRCRLHGGCSTSPTTAEGRARFAESNRRRAKAKDM